MWPPGPTAEQLLIPVAPTVSKLLALLRPGLARLERAARAEALGNAIALAFGLARAHHDLVVGRARAGIGAVDDDLVDAVLLCASAGAGSTANPAARPAAAARVRSNFNIIDFLSNT